MLDRYTTGLLTVQSACARKNLDLSIQSDAFRLQLKGDPWVSFDCEPFLDDDDARGHC